MSWLAGFTSICDSLLLLSAVFICLSWKRKKKKEVKKCFSWVQSQLGFKRFQQSLTMINDLARNWKKTSPVSQQILTSSFFFFLPQPMTDTHLLILCNF